MLGIEEGLGFLEGEVDFVCVGCVWVCVFSLLLLLVLREEGRDRMSREGEVLTEEVRGYVVRFSNLVKKVRR